MPLSRRHGLLACLLFLVACLGDESSGPRPVPSALEIAAGGTQTGVVAQPLDTALTVRVLDQHGEPLAGVLVQFVLADTAGTLSHLTRTTGPDGQAATVWTLPQTAGEYAALARVAELDSVTFAGQAGPASASQLLIVAGDSQWTTVGQALDSAVRVRVVDPFGNPVSGQAVTFLIQFGGGSLSAALGVTDSLGQAETRWTPGTNPAVATLRASVAPLPPVIAAAFVFPVQPPDSLSFGSATCHLPAAGGLRCWGPGAGLVFGTGDTATAFTPVSGPLPESFVSLHGGDAATCGLTADGTAWCWGLAIGLKSDVPVMLTVGRSWRELTPGGNIGNLFGPAFWCGVSTLHQGFCWGKPGPLGNGSATFLGTPALISGGHRWRQIAAGYDYACGVSTRAVVLCWGANDVGQLGNGTTTAAPVPVPILSDERFQAVAAASEFTCALTLDGRVFCWGRDAFGNTGSGGGPLPRPVDNTLRFVLIRANNQGACGLTTTGETRCWGNNQRGTMGSGPQYHEFYVPPTRIAGDPGLTQLAMGVYAVCGVDGGSGVWCWGDNTLGHVGIGDTRIEASPDPVSGDPGFSSIVAGATHTCGLTAAGEAWCWGSAGTLGQGSPVWTASVSPIPVQGGLTFTALSTSFDNTCGLTASGSVYCWGYGPGGWAHLPALVPGGQTFTAIAAGTEHFCGITLPGPTLCWGQNSSGQLGDSTLTSKALPVPVAGGHLFAQVVAGTSGSCGVDSMGGAFCWGNGTLGDGSIGGRPYPGPVSGGLVFQRLAGPNNGVMCGVTTGGDGWCWGHAIGNRFGNGASGVPQPSPVPVTGGHQFTEISVGGHASCGVTTGASVLCWGENLLGSLGTGDTTSSAVPVPVAGGFSYSRVAVGGWFGCATGPVAGTHCWGFNPYGELGNGEGGIIPVPRWVP